MGPVSGVRAASDQLGHAVSRDDHGSGVRLRLRRVKRHASRGISPEVDAINDPRLIHASLPGNVFNVDPEQPRKLWIIQRDGSNRVGDGDCLRVARRMSRGVQCAVLDRNGKLGICPCNDDGAGGRRCQSLNPRPHGVDRTEVRSRGGTSWGDSAIRCIRRRAADDKRGQHESCGHQRVAHLGLHRRLTRLGNLGRKGQFPFALGQTSLALSVPRMEFELDR